MNQSALEGRVAVITGASSGIGAAVARALASTGVSVVLGARREDRLVGLEEEIRSGGGDAAHRRTDVTRRTDLEALASLAIERFGSVDILVNNAGVMPLSPVSQLQVQDWERMVDVNIKGVLYGIAAVLPHMLERESGHIVNVGSVAGRRPFPGAAVYSATKFAVRSLTWGMQLELSASRGIRVTDIQPGMVDTELLQHVPSQDVRRRLVDTWKDRRKLVGADVAGAVLYAVSAPDHVNVNEILIRPTDQPT